MKPRGVLPTYVTDHEVVLCKSAPIVRNTYEIRLALFMALDTERKFVLSVRPEAEVDHSLAAHITRFGGQVVRGKLSVYSIYFGAFDAIGEELDGWVACDNEAWNPFVAGVRSDWLRQRLAPGIQVPTADLGAFQLAIQSENTAATNIDDEPLCDALVLLARQAAKVNGSILVQ
jgi:hypothetical protein